MTEAPSQPTALPTGTDGREGGVTGEPEPDERKEDVSRADVETALKSFTEVENIS